MIKVYSISIVVVAVFLALTKGATPSVDEEDIVANLRTWLTLSNGQGGSTRCSGSTPLSTSFTMSSHNGLGVMSSTSTSLTAGAPLDQNPEGPLPTPKPTKSPTQSLPQSSVQVGDAGAGKAGSAQATQEPPVDSGSRARRPAAVSHFQLVFNPASLTDDVLGQRYLGQGTTVSPYLVSFLDDDSQNPMAWSVGKRWMINITASLATFAVAFASSVYTGSFVQVRERFHVSQEVAILGVSFYVLGFAIGPLLWAPASEYYGRQPILFLNMMFLAAFSAGAAGAQNIQALLVLRMLAGSLGCGPMTNSIGVMADIFSAEDRGLAGALFCLAPFLGPSLGPVIGGFLSETEGWRWVEGLIAIFAGALWILSALVLPETYAPVLLRRRATKLSAATGRVYVSHLDLSHRHVPGMENREVQQAKEKMGTETLEKIR